MQEWSPHELRALGARLATAVVVFVLFWIASKIVHFVIARLHKRMGGNVELLDLLGRIAGLGLLTFGAITALGTLGIDVSALVAGLGLTGFALGFAFRDVLSNVLAGVLILLYRPFGRGDHIAVAGFDGIVGQIDLRYTTIRTEQKIILIPNANLFTNPIEIWRASPATPQPAPELASTASGKNSAKAD